ncbi:MAG: hypothetical protein V1898_04920 [Patescibacteria group bacterium]
MTKQDKILHILEQHSKMFKKNDLSFKKIDSKFDKIDIKFRGIDNKLDIHMAQIIKNTEDIDWIKKNMVTKADHQDVLNILDSISTTVNIIRQDHYSAIEWLKRHELRITNIESKI